ncbi:phosphoserine phosphatase [Inhella inkyongensis]|uniref:phosphoserine phosphatase n=1 Tax=Inhella inkyongensis TaxID=392593 RepID=A0A840S881_9BURK|nr:HAD family hydrolase [Inhella inkyongensis]MBB5204629.1 phosphoserine phosphatase [Inhella inkyongensis]
MKRRQLSGLLGMAGLATLALPQQASAKGHEGKGMGHGAGHDMLGAGAFAPVVKARFQAVLRKAAKSKQRPYAVFDWDNTSIMNDTEEALLMYQINQLAFAMPPEQFQGAITRNVPPGNFLPAFKNAAGEQTSLETVVADLMSDYQFLWANYKGMKGSRSLEEMHATEQFQDFRAKLYFLYEAINDTHGTAVGYPWVVYLFGGLTVEQVSALAEASNDHGLGDALRKVKHTSPASLPGKAGVVTVSQNLGLRLTPEIANIMAALRHHGVDVYVSTASLEDVVRVFASTPKYGYHVKPENVIGLRLEMEGNVYKPEYRKGWPLNWGPGKTEVIKRELQSKKGYGPLMVFGDSDGDYDMLRDFPDTEFSLIVNRLKKGPIGTLCKQAVEQAASAAPRFVLQGRDERTGHWLPEDQMIKLGTTVKKLLP